MNDNETAQTSPINKRFAITSILLGLLGWIASFELLTEYIKTLITPGYSPNCNISVLVTCAPNMGSAQGSVFGFSNTILGIAGFFAPIIVGFAILAGAKFKDWFWRIYLIGLAFGFGFVTWLQYQSIFALHTLCPWCMVAWLAMIPLWWYSLATLMKANKLAGNLSKAGATLLQWSFVIILINLIIIAAVAQFKLNWLFTEFGIGSY